MRHLGEVIQQLLAEIPEDYPEQDTLTETLRSIQKRLSYRAPETIEPADWWKVGTILDKVLGEPTEDWMKRIANIFGDRDYYDI